MVSRLILFLLFIHFICGCDIIANEEVCNANFESETYRNDELQIKINLPINYRIINSDPTFYVMAYIYDPKLSEDYVESLGINYFVNEDNQSLTDIYNSSIEQDLKLYNSSKDILDFKIEENQSMYINEVEIKSAKISYQQKGQLPLTLFDYYYLHKDHAYKFTFACNQGDADSLECKFIDIMKSLKSI